MGIIPLQYLEGQNADTLDLTGKEKYTIKIPKDIRPLQQLTVEVGYSYFCRTNFKLVLFVNCSKMGCLILSHKNF
jgi:aconitate hydratase